MRGRDSGLHRKQLKVIGKVELESNKKEPMQQDHSIQEETDKAREAQRFRDSQGKSRSVYSRLLGLSRYHGG